MSERKLTSDFQGITNVSAATQDNCKLKYQNDIKSMPFWIARMLKLTNQSYLLSFK